MKTSDAVAVVRVLTGAFPDLTLEPDGVKVWADLIGELQDYATAEKVALDIARNSTKPPTIAFFRNSYMSEKNRQREQLAAIRGLAEPEGERELPETVAAWMAGHGIGEP